MTTPEELDALQAELRIIGCHSNGDARCTCSIGSDADAAITALRARVAELEARASDREEMHRRAQKAEGVLDRTMFILDGILKTYIYPETHLSLIKAIEAAHESARGSSGRVFQMSHDFQRRRVREAEARAERAEAELARRGQVQVKPLVWPDFREGGTCGRPHHFQYFVTQDRHGVFWAHFDMSQHGTLEAAQQHCEQHYQRAALVSPGDGWRSFTDAADGRPLPPMGDDLMIAGLSHEDARFVAVQLAHNGLMLVPAPPASEGA